MSDKRNTSASYRILKPALCGRAKPNTLLRSFAGDLLKSALRELRKHRQGPAPPGTATRRELLQSELLRRALSGSSASYGWESPDSLRLSKASRIPDSLDVSGVTSPSGSPALEQAVLQAVVAGAFNRCLQRRHKAASARGFYLL